VQVRAQSTCHHFLTEIQLIYIFIYIHASRLHSKWGRRKAEYIDSSSASPPGEKPAQVSGGRRGVARRPNRALGRSGRDQAPGTRGAPRASARFRRVGKEEPVGAGRCTRPAWVKDPTSPGGTGRDRTRVRGGWVLQGRCPWTPSNLRVPSPLFPGGRPDPLPPRQIAAPHCARVCGFLALAPPSGASSRAEVSLDSEDFQGQRDTRSTGSLGGPISLAIHIV